MPEVKLQAPNKEKNQTLLRK